MSDRVNQIKVRLQQALEPSVLQVVDDSAAHYGHPGAAAGGGHFKVMVVSNRFANLPLVQRHRLIYQALQDMLEKEIHAISIQALTPQENIQ